MKVKVKQGVGQSMGAQCLKTVELSKEMKNKLLKQLLIYSKTSQKTKGGELSLNQPSRGKNLVLRNRVLKKSALKQQVVLEKTTAKLLNLEIDSSGIKGRLASYKDEGVVSPRDGLEGGKSRNQSVSKQHEIAKLSNASAEITKPENSELKSEVLNVQRLLLDSAVIANIGIDFSNESLQEHSQRFIKQDDSPEINYQTEHGKDFVFILSLIGKSQIRLKTQDGNDNWWQENWSDLSRQLKNLGFKLTTN